MSFHFRSCSESVASSGRVKLEINNNNFEGRNELDGSCQQLPIITTEGTSNTIIHSDSQQSLNRLFNPAPSETSIPLRERNLPLSFFNPAAAQTSTALPNSNNSNDNKSSAHVAGSNSFHCRSTSFQANSSSNASPITSKPGRGFHMRTHSAIVPMTNQIGQANLISGSTGVISEMSTSNSSLHRSSGSLAPRPMQPQQQQQPAQQQNHMGQVECMIHGGPELQNHNHQPQQQQQSHFHSQAQHLHYRNYSSPAFVNNINQPIVQHEHHHQVHQRASNYHNHNHASVANDFPIGVAQTCPQQQIQNQNGYPISASQMSNGSYKQFVGSSEMLISSSSNTFSPDPSSNEMQTQQLAAGVTSMDIGSSCPPMQGQFQTTRSHVYNSQPNHIHNHQHQHHLQPQHQHPQAHPYQSHQQVAIQQAEVVQQVPQMQTSCVQPEPAKCHIAHSYPTNNAYTGSNQSLAYDGSHSRSSSGIGFPEQSMALNPGNGHGSAFMNGNNGTTNSGFHSNSESHYSNGQTIMPGNDWSSPRNPVYLKVDGQEF